VPTRSVRVAIALGSIATLVMTATSLAASYAVYDRSSLYTWLTALVPVPERFVNLHSGLDESSAALSKLWPGAARRIFDLYDDRLMSEPSIRIARATSSFAIDQERVRFDRLPLESGESDVACLLFAAHELRTRPDREALFAEVARVLRPGGRLVLVEHVRDAVNFAAFGPGALHFYPAAEWRALARGANLTITSELRFAWLVRAFVLQKADER
jgi:SAM-dependent methyltransferase